MVTGKIGEEPSKNMADHSDLFQKSNKGRRFVELIPALTCPKAEDRISASKCLEKLKDIQLALH